MKTQASDRFTKDLDKYLDISQWMRKNLTQGELDYLRGGACAFHPLNGLAGATKAVVLDFCKEFAEEADGHHMHGWQKHIDTNPAEAAVWSGWTDEERGAALLISDVLADNADFDEVNPSACADLTDDPDGRDVLEEYLVDWMQSDDKTLVKHARKVARMAGVNLNELI
jgi:hypothetical protein